MRDLLDFTIAQLDEAEERILRVLVYSRGTYHPGAGDRWVARRVGPELRILRVHAELPSGSLRPKTIVDLDPLTDQEIGRYLEQFDPHSMLLDIQAKRRIIGRHPGSTADDECPGCGSYLSGVWVTGPGDLCPELADVGSAYAGRIAYRPEWAPDA